MAFVFKRYIFQIWFKSDRTVYIIYMQSDRLIKNKSISEEESIKILRQAF